MGKRRMRDRRAAEEKLPAEQAEPPTIATPPASAGNAAITRLFRSATSTTQVQAPEGFEDDLKTGGGQPIPTTHRSTLEAGLGASLEGVRLHTGSQAAKLASDVSARAFTVGQDVYFGQGEYSPDSQSGYRLLAHEVTHTVQQSSASPGGSLEVSTPDSTAERQADHVADQLAAGQQTRETTVEDELAPGIHRKAIQRVPLAGTAERELDAKWQIKPSGVDKGLADKILAQKSIAMTFYTAYETGLPNDNHFKDLGIDFAKTYKTLGMTSSDQSGGALQMGIPIPVKSRGDVEQAITSVAQTVHLLANERQGEEGGPLAPPQIQTVAIFAHGINKSLGIDPAGEPGTNWFKAKEIKTFVAAIRGRVAGNVSILLYACSAGGTANDPTLKDTKSRTESGGPGGEDSFAAQLAAELGGEATVFAHNIYDHAEANPQARQFTADSTTGKHMFDLIYGDEFLRSEATRLGLTTPEATAKLRKEMWEHYYDAVKTDYYRINSKNRHFQIGGIGGVGAAMFMDPDNTKAVLREDFTKFWLNPTRVKALTGE